MRASMVTGMGVVSSAGMSVDAYSAALFRGECQIGDLAGFVRDDQPIRIGAPVRDFEPRDHFDAKSLAQLDRFSQFGAIAARQAWAESGLSGLGVPGHRIGVIVGTALTGQDILDRGFRRILLENRKTDLLCVPMTMGNAPASRIAQECGAQGPVFGVTSACASGLHAILLAHQMIKAGIVDVMIAGGTDSCFSDGFLRAWDCLKVVSPEPCRPFSMDRRGLSIGEGAGMLVIESTAHAAARGARSAGRIMGGAMSCDAGNLLAPDPMGMLAAMRQALADSGVSEAEIDYVNAHGTGTLANDRAETTAILDIFGGRPQKPALSAIKSMIGHSMGASGALETIATLAALQAGIVPPTINFTASADDCPIDVTPNGAVRRPLNYALKNAFAFGGLNCALVLGAPQ